MEAIPLLTFLVVLTGSTAFWLWALVDVLRRPGPGGYRTGSQLLWALVIALTHFVGAAAYVFFGRPRQPHPSGVASPAR